MTHIYLTGGAGFIGSVILKDLNNMGLTDITVIDDLDTSEKWKNLVGKEYTAYIDHLDFIVGVTEGLYIDTDDIVIHMGACSATTEKDSDYLMHNNTNYSRTLYEACKERNARLIYASSAATYGDGSKGYDDHEFDLEPLNMYGYSKHLFDQRVLRDTKDFSLPAFQIVGLKFFNVYGPNEYHKGSMSSVIYHGFHQLQDSGEIKLFRSYHRDYEDGEQKRDFIYVKDISKIVKFFMDNRDKSGIYNVGTGQARTFNDLANAVFQACDKEQTITYIDMPDHLRGKYQYYTQAEMSKLREAGYEQEMTSLEEGVRDYVQEHLLQGVTTY